MEITLTVLVDFVIHAGLFAAGIVATYYVSIRYC